MFNDESLDFQVYNNIEKIIFLDNQGDEYEYNIFEQSIQEDFDYFYTTQCKEGNKSAFYNGQKVSIRFLGPDSTIISFDHEILFVFDESDLKEDNLVDIISLGIFDSSPANVSVAIAGAFQFLTSSRNSHINKDEMNDSRFTVRNDVNILGKNFSEVYEPISSNENVIQFNKEFGVVSFLNKNNIQLVFDRFE